jgi:hypothetical protein
MKPRQANRARPAWAGPLTVPLTAALIAAVFLRADAIARLPGDLRLPLLVPALRDAATGIITGIGFEPRRALFRRLLGWGRWAMGAALLGVAAARLA